MKQPRKSLNAVYQDNWRQNLEKKGLRRLEVKCHPDDVDDVKSYVKTRNKQRGIE